MDKKPLKKNTRKKPIDFLKLDIDAQITLIDEVLREDVYMALAMDGGGLEIMDIEDANVLIRYYGTCGNCPMAETSTLMFIQNTLQEKVDPRIQVKVV